MAKSPVFTTLDSVNGALRSTEHDALKWTDAERAAGVTPVNYAYGPVYAVRYGAPTDGVTSAVTQIGAADSVAQQDDSAVTFSSGIYYIDSNLTITADIVMLPGAMFRVATGVTLKLLGQVTAPAQKIYDLVGTGTVMFGSAANQWPRVRSIVHPEHWGAGGLNGSGDDTVAVQAAFDSHRPVVFLQHYPVTQVRVRGNELFIDFNGFELQGIAASGTASVLDIKCGYSALHNIQVSAEYNPLYESAIHWYTNDLNTYYPGFNRIVGLWPRNALVGLCIGALPSQLGVIDVQGSVKAEDIATDAPLSESSVWGFSSYACVQCIWYEQPNGKLTFQGSQILGSNVGWSSYGASGYTDAFTCSLTMRGEGSELSLQGGELAQVYESSGLFLDIEGGQLFVTGAVVEALCPSFLAGNARVAFHQCIDLGFNFPTSYAPFYVDDAADGWLLFSDSRIVMPATYYSTDNRPFVRGVSDISGTPSTNTAGFEVQFKGMELRDVPFIGTTSYLPPCTGVDCVIKDSKFSSYSGSRSVLLKIDEQLVNALASFVDVSNYIITAYGANGNAASGGWTFAVSNAGTCNWGSTASSVTQFGKTLDKSLRLQAPTSQTTSATSPKIPVHPERTYLLKGRVKTGTSGATVLIRCAFYKWDDSASGTATVNIISCAESAIGSTDQQLLGRVTVPKDAVKAELFLYVENGATMYVTDLALV